MGYVTHKIEISLRLDNHNGSQQECDKQLAREIERRIGDMLDEPQYARLCGAVF